MSEVAVEPAEWRWKNTAKSARPEPDAGTEIRGVYQLLGGAYGASIWDRSSQTQVWLGTFHTAEDASRVYGAAAANLARPRARKDAARPEPGARSAFRRVYPLRSGAFGASIRDSSSRTRVWLGSFGSVEDMARVYAAAAAAAKLPTGARKLSKFRGVTRACGKYGARITHSKGTVRTQVWLGTFESAEEAARAYDAAAVKLRGKRAITNFSPDSVMAGTQRADLSTAEWQKVHELLKGMDSIHDIEALIQGAAILYQIALARRHVDGGERRTNIDDDPN